jgi:hypothetical protein
VNEVLAVAIALVVSLTLALLIVGVPMLVAAIQ